MITDVVIVLRPSIGHVGGDVEAGHLCAGSVKVGKKFIGEKQVIQVRGPARERPARAGALRNGHVCKDIILRQFQKRLKHIVGRRLLDEVVQIAEDDDAIV